MSADDNPFAPLLASPFAALLDAVVDRPGAPPTRAHVITGRVHIIRDDDRGGSGDAQTIAETRMGRAIGAADSRKRGLNTTAERRALREAEDAARGIRYLPLKEGQKRRRRVDAQGNPVKRARRGSLGVRPRSAAAIERPATAAQIAAIVAAKAPPPQLRAPGEMPYGQAARLIHRANDGDLVDLDYLARAHETVAKARATPLAA